MKKKRFFIIVFLIFLFLAQGIKAKTEEVQLNQVDLVDYFYSQTFDNLVLDFTLKPAEDDILNSLVVKNEGTARQGGEIEKLVLWQDEGKEGFDGFGVDKEIATATFDANNYSWIFDDLSVEIPSSGRRLFVSLETKKNGTNGRSFQFSLPAYVDWNNNNEYDSGDLGIFFASGKGLPLNKLVNQKKVTFRQSADGFAPLGVIINLKDNQIIQQDNYLIKGKARDQGGSYPESLEICLDSQCFVPEATSSYFASWQYQWENILPGEHSIYLKIRDFNGNFQQTKAIKITRQVQPAEEEQEEEQEQEQEQEEEQEQVISEENEEENLPSSEEEKIYKTPDSPALYLIKNGQRHLFPHSAVYHSWGYPADFSTVEVVTPDVLESYPLGEPVKFKDGTLFRGTTKSVHGKDASAVFYVEQGKLRPVISAEVYHKLFGDPHWQKVIWVPDSYLSKFAYPLAEPITEDTIL